MRTQKLLCFILALMASFTLKAQEQQSPQGIQFFQGSWDEAKAEAKKEKKPIFVDAYTSWCGPCKKMSREVFPQKTVGDFYNQNFIAYKLDMEKGEGVEFAKRYDVHLYPSYLYFDSKGERLHRSLGSCSPKEFIQIGKDALDSNHSLYGMMAKFQNGKRDQDFLVELLGKTYEIDDDACNAVRKAYWATQPMDKLIEPGNWEIFKKYENDITSPQYNYVVDHIQNFGAKYGTDVVEKTVYAKAGQSMELAADRKDKTLFEKAIAILKKSQNDDVIRYGAFAEIMYYKQMGMWDKFSEKGDEYAQKYSDDDVGLNQMAWAVYTSSKDRQLLEKALDWSKKSVDKDKGYANMDTYASLLYANGKYTEADMAARDAIELAKKENQEYGSTQQLLEKITLALHK